MNAVDHDLTIKIKQALESFIREVESRFSRIEKQEAEICQDLRGFQEEFSQDIGDIRTELAVQKNEIDHLRDAIKTNKEDTSKEIETNRRTIGEWVALAATLGTILGAVLSFFIR